MTNTINTGRTLADNELMTICGGSIYACEQEKETHKLYYNVGDIVEVYITGFHCHTVRCRIVDRKWSYGSGSYKLEIIDTDSFFAFLIPEWVCTEGIE